ncbi:MAG: flagellar basal body-associated protein FliL [Noviherbaspirillum sp.]
MATSAPRTAPKAAAAPAAPAQSRLVIYLLLALVLLLAAGGAGAAWYFLKQDDGAVAKPKPPPPPVFLPLEAFTVNLQGPGIENFLQVNITLQVATQPEVEKIKLYMPQVRSRLLLHLSGKSAAQISTVEGKLALADEISALLEKPFAEGAEPLDIANVFFTSFVIQ